MDGEKPNAGSSSASIAVLSIILLGLLGLGFLYGNNRQTTQPTRIPAAQQVKPSKPRVIVTSKTVTPGDGDFQYHFEVSNEDRQQFNGTVEIKLVYSNGQESNPEAFPISLAPGTFEMVHVRSTHSDLDTFKFSATSK